LQRQKRIECQCRRQEWFTGGRNAHAGSQRRSGTASIVIVVAVALGFDWNLSVALRQREQQASGGRTPLARTDPRRHQQPQYDEDHQQRA